VNPNTHRCCSDNHDEIVALLAREDLRRVPSQDLVDEQEHLARELVAGRVDGEASPDLAAFYRHRLEVIDAELSRRRRLECHGAPAVPGYGRIPAEIITEIKERIDLVNLVGEDLEMVWYRAGKAQFRCRLHGDGIDRDPSLTVYEDDSHWYCYGCNDGGDAFNWLIKARQMQWVQAVLVLAARCHIELPPKRHPRPLSESGHHERDLLAKVLG
jgi:CHC2 zinc finger